VGQKLIKQLGHLGSGLEALGRILGKQPEDERGQRIGNRGI
jgi:hypothetical protein